MRRHLPPLIALSGFLAACGGEPQTVEVTKLSGERFRVSVVAPDIAAGKRMIAPEAEKLCGRKPAGVGEALMEPARGPTEPKVVQEIACGEAPPEPAVEQPGLAAAGSGAAAP